MFCIRIEAEGRIDSVSRYNATTTPRRDPLPITLVLHFTHLPSFASLSHLCTGCFTRNMNRNPFEGLPNTSWVVVQGSEITTHICNNKRFFQSYQNIQQFPTDLGLALAVGRVKLRMPSSSQRYTSIWLERCYFVPTSPVNIISAEVLQRDGDIFFNPAKDSLVRAGTNKVLGYTTTTRRNHVLNLADMNDQDSDPSRCLIL